MFVDLDDLKTVNDTLGHTYGDGLIFEAGNRLAREIGQQAAKEPGRETYVGRIGGDEFLVIFPGLADRQVIARLVDRIVEVLCQDIKLLGKSLHISASVGVAVYPDDGDKTEEIFKNADNAMYAAKRAGKSCWRFYEAVMQAEAYEKMLLTNSLYSAVERGGQRL